VSKEKRTLTRQDMVEAVTDKLAITKTQASDLVDLVFDTLQSAMQTQEKIKISGFGNFVIREKKARTGRNPQTGATIRIGARRVVTFHASAVLRAAVNSGLE